jgi:hypothetical protein
MVVTAAPANGLATASLVLGILSVVFFWLGFFGIIMAILAVVFGAVGLSRAGGGAPNRGLAVAGLVLGIVSILLFVVVVLALIQIGQTSSATFQSIAHQIPNGNGGS